MSGACCTSCAVGGQCESDCPAEPSQTMHPLVRPSAFNVDTESSRRRARARVPLDSDVDPLLAERNGWRRG